MTMELVPLLVTMMAFGSVAIIVFVVGRYAATQASMQRRLPIAASVSARSRSPETVVPNFFLASLAAKFDERKFGIEGQIRTKLRRDLIRAGYFSEQAIQLYILARLAIVVLLPTFTYLLITIFFRDISIYKSLGAVAITAAVAVLGPDAYIARRGRLLQQEYRLVFPDLTDMLVVCIDAGLSLDAAFARIQPEVSKQSRALGVNLVFLGAETRAGRGTADALAAFAERLNLDEARAFVIMLRQSLELGTDVGQALRAFSDEMRTKRLLRAEETANKLPVKMVVPLGAFIFPVVLLVVMLPVIIRLLAISHAVGG
jgi:tight adherence protein C